MVGKRHKSGDDVIVRTPNGDIATRITAVNRDTEGEAIEVRVEGGGPAPIAVDDILGS